MLKPKRQGSNDYWVISRHAVDRNFVGLVPKYVKNWLTLACVSLGVLATTNAWARKPDCLLGGLEVDMATSKATLRVASESVPMLDLQRWQASDFSRPGDYVFTLDISSTVLPKGREYPMVIKLGPQTVAINVRHLINSDGSKFDRLCSSLNLGHPTGRKDPPVALLQGYALFVGGHAMPIANVQADQRVPQKVLKKYEGWLRRAQVFYRNALGPEKIDLHSMIFLVEGGADARKGCEFNGSSLPGLLLIGVREGCFSASARFAEELPRFIAHEAFHQWNQDIEKVRYLAPETRMMLLEGGAQMAASLFLAEAGGREQRGTAHDVAAAAESCVDQAGGQRRSLKLLLAEGEHQLAYSCGMVYTFLRLVRINQDPAIALGPLWTYLLQSAVSSPAPGDVALNEVFGGEILLKDNLVEIFAQNGYMLHAETGDLSRGQQFRVAVELMREVSRNDCRGKYGFFTGGGEVVIDPEIKGCRSLRVGGTPISVNGFNLRNQVMLARSAWLSACQSKGNVRVDYSSDHAAPSMVSCRSPPAYLYSPLRLSPITYGDAHE